MIAEQQERPTWLERALERPIAIFGQGQSGQAAAALLHGFGATFEVFDQKHEDPERRQFDLDTAERFGLAICSPGFPKEHAWCAVCRQAEVEIVPESDLGASLWKGPIVVVTGTNGKTTLTEFLTDAFNSAGMEAYACGNIGVPMSRLLAQDCNREAIAVCEVSSFQAEISRRLQGDYVLWTNFDEDHLDRHGTLRRYFECKYRMVESLRGEGVFYDASVEEAAREFGFSLPSEGLVSMEQDPVELGVSGTIFESPPELNTYLIARALWLRMGLSEDELVEAANNFKKSPHRMELVCVRDGVSYWDDSKATNFHAVYAALKRFTLPVVWIGGGKDKGGNIKRFAQRLAPQIASAHLIGETAEALAMAFSEHGVKARVYGNLEDATAGAREAAGSGVNILLSPGFASLDMFEGYSQRGEAFKKAINSLEEL
ncbi:UDP-N-acetylmuramoyl-L-alanine--D-glutamate ligase [Pelagicoccus sp. SDUM812003]|uniref:UDP-N-acetylmuramoyl-L-alanine--D-glutamate ligase n=1 Tax=Pelagicoccus sp. SDUM812003 TaxID=3041267 RepID=UPI00280F322E|nr:UDP-N-acetylmuramoyl-L-alanine--D-glutamate ligase [Pelagicoccus sp. SDUM812003]MDQ8204410.1 UDP-N-acetylmuramoyl-L-alanine--D-glutamate ligase [Pelagicoccus sp. SDUM812003]